MSERPLRQPVTARGFVVAAWQEERGGERGGERGVERGRGPDGARDGERGQERGGLSALGGATGQRRVLLTGRLESGVSFIEHGLMLNELYVRVLEAPLLQALATAQQRAAQEKRPSRSFTRLKAGLYARAAVPGMQALILRAR